jgi:hypothetical protein
MLLRSQRNPPARLQRIQRRQRRQRIQKAVPILKNIEELDDNNNDQDVNSKQIFTNVKSIPSYTAKILDFLRKNETCFIHLRIRRKFKEGKQEHIIRMIYVWWIWRFMILLNMYVPMAVFIL